MNNAFTKVICIFIPSTLWLLLLPQMRVCRNNARAYCTRALDWNWERRIFCFIFILTSEDKTSHQAWFTSAKRGLVFVTKSAWCDSHTSSESLTQRALIDFETRNYQPGSGRPFLVDDKWRKRWEMITYIKMLMARITQQRAMLARRIFLRRLSEKRPQKFSNQNRAYTLTHTRTLPLSVGNGTRRLQKCAARARKFI
jgi:hypothetical protein